MYSFDDTNVVLGEVAKTFNRDEQVELTAYPGTYDLKAEATTQYGAFTQTDSVDIDPNQDNRIMIAFEGFEYSFDTNEPEANLFMNGESTGQKLAYLSSIGPFPEGSEPQLYAQINKNNGLIKTEDLTLGDDGRQHLRFMFDDEDSTEVSSAKKDKNEEEEPTTDDID